MILGALKAKVPDDFEGIELQIVGYIKFIGFRVLQLESPITVDLDWNRQAADCDDPSGPQVIQEP